MAPLVKRGNVNPSRAYTSANGTRVRSFFPFSTFLLSSLIFLLNLFFPPPPASVSPLPLPLPLFCPTNPQRAADISRLRHARARSRSREQKPILPRVPPPRIIRGDWRKRKAVGKMRVFRERGMDPSRRLPRRVPDHATIGKIGADSRKHRGRFFTPSREIRLQR